MPKTRKKTTILKTDDETIMSTEEEVISSLGAVCEVLDDVTLNGYSDKTHNLLVAHVLEAAHTIIDIMRNGDFRQRLKYDAALAILEMSGISRHPAFEREAITYPYSKQELESALHTLQETADLIERL